MVHIGPTPTCDVYVCVPVAKSYGWAWGSHPSWPGSVASEFAYTPAEFSAVARVYARTVSVLLAPAEVSRFVVVVRGRVTDMVLVRDEWCWCTIARKYIPDGDPIETVKPALRRYWEITGTLFTRRHFRSRVDG